MIREANSEDILLINSFLNEFKQTNITSISDNPFNRFVFYYVDDVPVGFMQYSLIYDRIELDYIFVLEKYRQNGIGSCLMGYLDNKLFSDNVTNISLEVSEDNMSAINLYKKFGFKEVARRKNYYENKDGLLLVKER